MSILRPVLRPVLGPVVRGVTEPRVGSVPGEYPHLLFTNGELGGWYDATDREVVRNRFTRTAVGLGSDSAGVVDVGLILDKKAWAGGALNSVLGADVAVNGGFDTDTAWTKGAGWTIAGGKAQITSSAGASSIDQYPLTLGTTYIVTLVVDSLSGAALRVFCGSSDSAYIAASGFVAGTYQLALKCAGTTQLRVQITGAGGSAIIDSISAKPVESDTAVQTAASLCPYYYAGGYLDHDAVDDKLTATFGSSLGASTIAYSTATTVSIAETTLTATVDLPQADWFECVVINRTLTAQEKATLTAHMNRSRRQGLAAAIAVWGDSMASGSGSSGYSTKWAYLLQSQFTPTRPRYSGGVGGNTLTQTRDLVIADPYYKGSIVIIWDKLNSSEPVADWKAAMGDIIAQLTTDRFLILSPTNGSGEESGTAYYDNMAELNAWLAATYPDNYYDIRSYLISDGLTDAGITPTAQDTTDMAADTIPASLRSDTVHLNDAAQALVAQKVYEFIAAKGW